MLATIHRIKGLFKITREMRVEMGKLSFINQLGWLILEVEF